MAKSGLPSLNAIDTNGRTALANTPSCLHSPHGTASAFTLEVLPAMTCRNALITRDDNNPSENLNPGHSPAHDAQSTKPLVSDSTFGESRASETEDDDRIERVDRHNVNELAHNAEAGDKAETTQEMRKTTSSSTLTNDAKMNDLERTVLALANLPLPQIQNVNRNPSRKAWNYTADQNGGCAGILLQAQQLTDTLRIVRNSPSYGQGDVEQWTATVQQQEYNPSTQESMPLLLAAVQMLEWITTTKACLSAELTVKAAWILGLDVVLDHADQRELSAATTQNRITDTPANLFDKTVFAGLTTEECQLLQDWLHDQNDTTAWSSSGPTPVQLLSAVRERLHQKPQPFYNAPTRTSTHASEPTLIGMSMRETPKELLHYCILRGAPLVSGSTNSDQPYPFGWCLLSTINCVCKSGCTC